MLAVLLQGCLLDIAPSRQPLDEAWVDHMLAGEYGQWVDGERWPFAGRDEIRSSPMLASGTRYGISTSNQGAFGGAGWSTVGGLVARVSRPDVSVELFGREIARARGMKGNVAPQDVSYDFFLVVRRGPTTRGRLIRKWRFANEELKLRTAPGLVESLPADYPPEVRKSIVSEKNRRFFIDGFLSVDEERTTAIVAITGLVRPFQERVDLSGELP
jgi:hypothetical protein